MQAVPDASSVPHVPAVLPTALQYQGGAECSLRVSRVLHLLPHVMTARLLVLTLDLLQVVGLQAGNHVTTMKLCSLLQHSPCQRKEVCLAMEHQQLLRRCARQPE
jgi:hypothetical protein